MAEDVNIKWLETEKFIIKGLVENDSYFRRVINNLDKKIFSERSTKIIQFIQNYYVKYTKIPQYEIIKKVISKNVKNEKQEKLILGFITECQNKDFKVNESEEWLFDETKEYVKEKSIYNFASDLVEEMYSQDGVKDYEHLHKKMSDIVSVNWDEDLGVFYSDMMAYDDIYDSLEDMNQRIPLGIKKLDDAIGGGIVNKSLAVVAGSSGTGKTLIMGNIAANAIKAGKNVVYISFEITKEHMHQRFTATFTDHTMRNIIDMRNEIKEKIRKAYEIGNIGEFVIAEFPPSSITSLQLDNYLTNLKLKKGFEPDLIIVDYLGIMKPIDKNAQSSYERGKEVCENLRALGYKHNCPIVTGAQNNRSSIGEVDVGMESLSDSFGIGMTADLIISVTKPEALDQQSQLRFKITKSRLCKEGHFVIIDVDYDKMKLDCDVSQFPDEDATMQDTVDRARAHRERMKERQKEAQDSEVEELLEEKQTNENAKSGDIVDEHGIII
jgi:replicative DNA helicase